MKFEFYRRPLSWLLPIALAACASNGSKPDAGNMATPLQSKQASAALPAYDDQDLVSVFAHASLRRKNGDYAGSNTALERAYGLSEERYTQRISEMTTASLLKPGATPYRPNRLEIGFISYLKALNFLDMIAQGAAPLPQTEAAAVEMRRLDVLQGESRYLRDMGDEADRHNDLAEFIASMFAERSKNELSEGLVDIQAPWLYAFSGIVFELDKNLDSARLSYQRALDALPTESLSEANRNLKNLIVEGGLRSLQQLGYETQAIAESPFALASANSANAQALDEQHAEDQNQGIWLIAEEGELPAKAPLEMLLTADRINQRLILRPMVHGNDAEKQAQRDHFAALSLLYQSPYKDAVVIELGDNWSAADNLGATETIGGGIRIFIDYFSEQPPTPASTLISPDGQVIEVQTIADIAGDLRRYQQLTLQQRFEEALIREVSKSAAYKSMTGGVKLPFSLGGAMATFSAGADLRQWQQLPAAIRVARIPASLKGQTLQLNRGDQYQDLHLQPEQALFSIDIH